jgi:hypothetical protein
VARMANSRHCAGLPKGGGCLTTVLAPVRAGPVVGVGGGGYTMARETGDPGQNGHNKGGLKSAETIAFMLLAGIVVGLLVGYGLDRLLHTTPVFIAIGVFAGCGVALYAVYLETK